MWWESDLWWCVKQSSWPRFVTVSVLHSKGAFTPDANEALSASDLHVKSMQRRELTSCGAVRANEAAR